MTEKSNVLVFPENGGNNNGSIDPALLFATMNNGGWGGMNNPFWMIFMLPFLYPFFNMFGGYGNWGGGNFGGGTGFLANQLNNDAGRDLLLQAINGRADALGQLANLTHSSIETVKTNLFTLQSAIQNVGAQVGMSGLETINALQLGNANLSRQICECCCENRLAIANQTNALQTSLAAHDASVRLQLAQNEAADQLSVCQQTNTLTRQADGNTNTIVKAIADQNAMIVSEVCALKERELQNKINTQGDIITQLRNQISNDEQTLKFNAAFHALDDKIDAIAAKQPNTVPVQWPNIVAANATPYVGGYYGFGYGQQTGFFN
jgi:hypothetical protein